MGANQAAILEAILEELKSLTQEIKGLRNDLRQNSKNLSSDMVDAIYSISAEAETKAVETEAEAAEEAFLSIFDWLATRNITVIDYKRPEPADSVFDQLATFLGERFDTLNRIHDLIRRNLSTGNSFTLNLSSSSQEEIANCTQFCTLLHQYAFLSSYKYIKYSKTIHAVPQRDGKVINFFTGGWFERFVFLKVTSLLSQNALDYVLLRNPKISLPNGDDFELDILFLVENEPLWLECKTGDYQSYITKYSDARQKLTISNERSLLIILGISDELTSNLTDLYPITVANENNFLAQCATALDLVDLPGETRSDIPVQPGKLSSLLNKAGLRPLPELRSEVIGQLIKVVNSMSEPKPLVEIKSVLAKGVQTSKSKLQDVLNAVVKSECLLNEQGEPVLSFTIPFSSLISLDASEIEQKCMESYSYAVLAVDPTFFDSEGNMVEFEQVTGGEMPDTKTVEQIRKKVQTIKNTV